MQSQYISIGKAAKLIGVTPTTLRRWEKAKKIKPARTPTNRRMYSRDEISSMVSRSLKSSAMNWAIKLSGEEPDKQYYCPTRDIFQARLDRMLGELLRLSIPEDDDYIISAISGEIGNNSFDHNLGSWPDVMGIFFSYAIDKDKVEVALADRGQGILKTLRVVRPDLRNDRKALKMAFTEKISGRAPESRGNGLKFVRENIKSRKMRLEFYSGKAKAELNDNMKITQLNQRINGCLAILSLK
jgi:hypothetical protein